MSSQHYDEIFRQAGAELRQLVNAEQPPKPDIPVDGTGDAVPQPQHEPISDRVEVMNLLKTRFVRYARLIRKLDACYSALVVKKKQSLEGVEL